MDELMGSNEMNMQVAAMTPAVILLVAVCSYALAGRLLGAFNFAELRQMIRRSD